MTVRFVALLALLASPLALAQREGAALDFERALALVPESPAVALAAGQVDLAQARLEAASGVVSGAVAAEVSQRVALAPGGASVSDIGPITASASLNVVPYGDAADAVTRARYALERATASLRDTRSGVVLEVVTQYLAVLRATEEEAADRAVLQVAQAALEGRRTQQRSGAATEADVLSAEIDVSDAQNEVAEVTLARDAALASLSQALGVSVTAVAGGVPTVALPALGNAEANLETRSDVQDARLSVAEAQLSRATALRGVLPRGELSAGYGSSDIAVAASIGTDTYQPEVGLSYDPDPDEAGTGNSLTLRASLSIPLASSTGAELTAVNGAVELAEGQLELTLTQARLDVQSARNTLTTAQNNLASSRTLVAQRQRSFAASRERLGLGLVAAYDVQDASAQLRVARVDLARLADDVLLAKLELLQALARDPLEVF